MVRVTRHCSRCQNPRVAATSARQLGSAAKPEMDPIAAAYDLVGALAADDVTSANHALPHTSALHVAIAANVLAQSALTSDLQELLQLLALQAEIDAIGAAGTPAKSAQTDDWEEVMAIDGRGMFLTCKYAIEQMLTTGGGSIVCLSSISGVAGQA
jgi:NAD(P)-dependent dehydrogenase (short-subunit alcohol dehydrogenase family)